MVREFAPVGPIAKALVLQTIHMYSMHAQNALNHTRLSSAADLGIQSVFTLVVNHQLI